MSGLDKNRKRNKTISFRVSPEEERILEARIKVAGVPKGEYILRLIIDSEVKVNIGKFQSDRLSIEIRRLSEAMESIEEQEDSNGTHKLLSECKALLREIFSVMNVSS